MGSNLPTAHLLVKIYLASNQEGAACNPCVSCGACCVAFRASFYWAEGDDTTEGGVPVHLTVQWVLSEELCARTTLRINAVLRFIWSCHWISFSTSEILSPNTTCPAALK